MPKPVTCTLEIWKTSNDVAHAAALLFAARVEDAVAKRGVARVAISGGSTPKTMLSMLADPSLPFANTIPWDKLYLYFVDERCVPPTDPESNYLMTETNLLSKVALPKENVFRMEGELDPAEAANRYESYLRNSMKLEGAESPRFDLLFLGMGPDGHTASLFPHTEGLHELGRLVIPNHVPQKDTWRVTLTSPVINQAAEVAFEIAGADKTDVLAEVLTGPRDPERLPSQLIRPASGKLLFLLDEAAAAKLPVEAEIFTTPNGSRRVGTLEI